MDQKREIIDIKGNKKELGCLGCAIQNGEVESPGGSIASTQYFDYFTRAIGGTSSSYSQCLCWLITTSFRL